MNKCGAFVNYELLGQPPQWANMWPSVTGAQEASLCLSPRPSVSNPNCETLFPLATGGNYRWIGLSDFSSFFLVPQIQ